jgi:hypothetical protein
MSVVILPDGTRIESCPDGECFEPAFASSMDIKVTDRCRNGCAFCHEGSTPGGAHADWRSQEFWNTLHPFTEVALGGGNLMEMDSLEDLLRFLASMRVIANATVRQRDFMLHRDRIANLVGSRLLNGIGISLDDASDDVFLDMCASMPNAVVHTIAGIDGERAFEKMASHGGLKVLVLGYKDLRRGHDLLETAGDGIRSSASRLAGWLERNRDRFAALSFDNLALEQLGVRSWVGDSEWESLYQGDDGSQTFYIDAVAGEYAVSSTSRNRKPLLESVDGMFASIRNRARGCGYTPCHTGF